VEIVSCVDGEGQPLVVLPTHRRDGLEDFDPLAMEGIDPRDLAEDVAHPSSHGVLVNRA
jgi:hypothetical protein